MKRFFIYFIISPLILVFLLLLTLAGLIFFRPTLVINPQSIAYVMSKTDNFKTWHWKKASIEHEWIRWNQRRFTANFQDFCLDQKNEKMEFETCLDEFSFDFILTYDLKTGLRVDPIAPIKLHSPILKLVLKDVKKENQTTQTFDYFALWDFLWGKTIPELTVIFEKIILEQAGKVSDFNLTLEKKREALSLQVKEFILKATPQEIELIQCPTFQIPGNYPTRKPLVLHDLKLKAKIQKPQIPIVVTGLVGPIPVKLTTQVKLPANGDFTSQNFIRETLLKTQAVLSIDKLKKTMASLAAPPFNELPAPLNSMEGPLESSLSFESLTQDKVTINLKTELNFSGHGQFLNFGFILSTPLNLSDYTTSIITAQLDFKKLALQLPRLSRKEALPQLYPDRRIQMKTESTEIKKSEKKSASTLNLSVKATETTPLVLKTNLLDEDLRISFEFQINKGKLKKGFIHTSPLRTTVFKRPIEIQKTRLTFQSPLPPVLKSSIVFLLPEYKITLKLEGPLASPRHTLSSVPPLPLNDIYAVLLFGRPLANLDPEAQATTNQTNRILAQGILSLSVLQFLSGTPIEYLGYDPNTGEAKAQIGLGKKTSLRLGAGGGTRSTLIRRSLGKGWYLDNSIQNNATNQSEKRDYGVMLERIIAY